MSKTITLDVPEDLYELFRLIANAFSRSIEEVALEFLTATVSRSRHQKNEQEALEARARFERHFGEVSLGFATGADNESIEADLAREYACPHEET